MTKNTRKKCYEQTQANLTKSAMNRDIKINKKCYEHNLSKSNKKCYEHRQANLTKSAMHRGKQFQQKEL